MSTEQAIYSASNAIVCTLASLAHSSTQVAGRASAAVDNSTAGSLDRPISGKVTVGTAPTVNTTIEVWLIPQLADGSWPDAFGGVDANVTVTSRGILTTYGKRIALISVDSATSNITYFFEESVTGIFGGVAPPKKYQLFFVQNTGVALNATAGNHAVNETPVTVGTV